MPLSAGLRPYAARSCAAAFAVSALSLAAASTAPAVVTHGVIVLDRNRQIVTTFRTAKCTAKAGDTFQSVAKSQGWTLTVLIKGLFSGFHDYLIALSAHAVVQVYLDKPENPDPYIYSNLNVPRFPSPGYGRLTFATRGTLMGVGVSPMWGEDLADAVIVTGVLKCAYPKKKPKR